MLFFQGILGIVFSLSFFILLFLIAWYIALPVLILLFILSLFKFIKSNHITFKITPRFKIYRSHKKNTPKNEKVIDVDYTEIY